MLALRPPGRDDKPLTQKRKAAFDREPRKASNAPPRPAHSAPPLRDGKLQQWVRESAPTGPELVEACEYLLSGAPYRGSSPFAAMEAVKALGGTWQPNPLKTERGDGMVSGWWVAVTDRGLLALLEAVDEGGRPIWSPWGVSVRSRAPIAELVRAFEEREKAMKSSPAGEPTASLSGAQQPVVHPSRGRFLFGDAPGMLRLPSSAEWDRLREELIAEGRAAVRPCTSRPPEDHASRCGTCGGFAFVQFEDDACPACRATA